VIVAHSHDADDAGRVGSIVPVPLPDPANELLEPPTHAESRQTARGVASAVTPPGGLTDLQVILIEALFKGMTGADVDVRSMQPMAAEELARHLAPRNLQFRTRGVQVMLLCALVLRPLPQEVVEQVNRYARALGVDERMIDVARRFAQGSLGLAGVDFERNGYTATWDPEDARALHVSVELQQAWDTAVNDPELAARWQALGELPRGTLGRAVWDMYRARGFVVPGLPGSAPPLLAQHDWVHVLGDYGTTVESELEVFALIARANDDMRAFSLLAMVVSLFETGYLRTGAGLFQADSGYLSRNHALAVRMADAMYRSARCRDEEAGSDSVDFLRVDWFSLAPLTLEEARERFRLEPKSPEAVAANSVGPWERGGISPFQERSGRKMAHDENRPYEAHGAEPV
jgi:hypothetical protein